MDRRDALPGAAPATHGGANGRPVVSPNDRRRQRKPAIYLAGKIAPGDFRHTLVPGLRGHRHLQGPLDCGHFKYVGPFFECCSHRCAHGPASHGVLGVPGAGCSGFERSTRLRVWQRNAQALRQADAVFAYIESNDAFGSLVEIGSAQAVGTVTWVLFAPGVAANEMWYAAQGAVYLRRRGGFTSRNVLRESLPTYFADFLRRIGK
jgi:hypothetical protein